MLTLSLYTIVMYDHNLGTICDLLSQEFIECLSLQIKFFISKVPMQRMAENFKIWNHNITY